MQILHLWSAELSATPLCLYRAPDNGEWRMWTRALALYYELSPRLWGRPVPSRNWAGLSAPRSPLVTLCTVSVERLFSRIWRHHGLHGEV